MDKLTILVDMDDTIERLLETWVSFLNRRHGTNVRCEDIREWDLTKAFPTLAREQIYAPLSDETLWQEVEPINEAIDSLMWMTECGHRVYIVTASAYQTIVPKMENILFKYFPFIPWDHVIISSNKQLIKGDVLFDDAPHNLENGNYFKVLVSAYHNRDYDAEANGMIRMDSWGEAKGIIKTLQKLKYEGGWSWL